MSTIKIPDKAEGLIGMRSLVDDVAVQQARSIKQNTRLFIFINQDYSLISYCTQAPLLFKLSSSSAKSSLV